MLDVSEAAQPNRVGSDGERGAALVEFAFISILLFVILFGIVEFGLAFRDRLTVANAVQSAGRVASRAAQAEEVDWLVLDQLIDTVRIGTDGDDIVAVQVYRSDVNGNPEAGTVNQYAFLNDGSSCPWSPCPNPAEAGWGYGGTWTPDLRDAELPDLDRIGVRVWWQHDYLFNGLLPLSDATCTVATLSSCWSDTAVFRMEPQDFGS